jgi:Protein of unknown function (DUF1488)
MPLASLSHAPSAAFGEISFRMQDGDKPVRVDVRDELLMLMRIPRPGTPNEPLPAFDEYRDQLERIASAKYDQGHFATYANSCVVAITCADWEHHRRGFGSESARDEPRR